MHLLGAAVVRVRPAAVPTAAAGARPAHRHRSSRAARSSSASPPSPRSRRLPGDARHCGIPIIITTVGGLVLGLLGLIGGPITMFKGLEQIGELLQEPRRLRRARSSPRSPASRSLALLVAASALFRGGRVFPATFIGVALGMLGARAHPVPAAQPRGRRAASLGVTPRRDPRRLGRDLPRRRDRAATSRSCRCCASSCCRPGCS